MEYVKEQEIDAMSTSEPGRPNNQQSNSPSDQAPGSSNLAPFVSPFEGLSTGPRSHSASDQDPDSPEAVAARQAALSAVLHSDGAPSVETVLREGFADKASELQPCVRRRLKQLGVFIDELAKTCHITESAKIAGWNRGELYKLKDAWPLFRELWDAARASAYDRMEGEAYRRAVAGTRRPVYQGGKLVGHEQQYSDRLMEILLRAHLPAYREKSEVSHNLQGVVYQIIASAPDQGGNQGDVVQKRCKTITVEPETPAKAGKS